MSPTQSKIMYNKIVETAWCPADIKSIRPEWSDEKCIDALVNISSWFEDRLIESGWDILEILLDMEYGRDEDEED